MQLLHFWVLPYIDGLDLVSFTELSPASTKNKHMVLPMDLTDTDKHASLAATVTRKFGKVGLLCMCHVEVGTIPGPSLVLIKV